MPTTSARRFTSLFRRSSVLVEWISPGALVSVKPVAIQFYDFMVPFVQTARTCKMRFIDPYVIYADQFKPTETPNEYVEFIRSIGQ
uniref:hypothetical protein n=1 Tax=Escherichia coli TaxID=562 RepID=UPI00159EE9CC|nr:hypothetical protein [Escherichia coli]